MENLELLFHEIGTDIENSYYHDIADYEEKIARLKEFYPQKDIEDIEDALNELKSDADRINTYYLSKNEALTNTNNPTLAEDIAMEIVGHC